MGAGRATPLRHTKAAHDQGSHAASSAERSGRPAAARIRGADRHLRNSPQAFRSKKGGARPSADPVRVIRTFRTRLQHRRLARERAIFALSDVLTSLRLFLILGRALSGWAAARADSLKSHKVHMANNFGFKGCDEFNFGRAHPGFARAGAEMARMKLTLSSPASAKHRFARGKGTQVVKSVPPATVNNMGLA